MTNNGQIVLHRKCLKLYDMCLTEPCWSPREPQTWFSKSFPWGRAKLWVWEENWVWPPNEKRWMKQFLPWIYGFLPTPLNHTGAVGRIMERKTTQNIFFHRKNVKAGAAACLASCPGWGQCWALCSGAGVGHREGMLLLPELYCRACSALGFAKCKFTTQGAPACRFCSWISVPSTLSALVMLPACGLWTLEFDVSGTAASMHTFLCILTSEMPFFFLFRLWTQCLRLF